VAAAETNREKWRPLRPRSGGRARSTRGGVTFVAGISESARTPEGRLRAFPGDGLTRALNVLGVPTSALVIMTKYVETSEWDTRGYGGSRGIPLSPRFLVDLVRSPTSFFVCREYGVETLLTVIVAKLRRRRALVFQEHAGRAGAPLSRLDLRYRRLIGWFASGFIANTPAAAEEIAGALGVPRARVFPIMMLVPPEQADLRRQPIPIPTPDTRPVFLFVGQLVLRKNVEALLTAAAHLRQEGLSFEVWVGGDGPDEARLRSMASELDVGSTVRFLGPIPHPSVGFLYESCDVFVMPSYADLLSVAVLEAVRFGKPIICSVEVGALGVVAHENLNAFAFDPAEPTQLADRMRSFIVDPGLATEMGSHSTAVMAGHTPDAAARALVAALESHP
jgi:glycosyltransferase involved in cell wall biosynthesis